MIYPSKNDYQNAVLIKLCDESNNNQIRAFWTQEPEKFLKMYFFMFENDIDIEIEEDENEKDPYNDKTGTIKNITFSTGGSFRINTIKIYLEIRDYM